MNDANTSFVKTWRRFLIEVELAKNYPRPYLLYTMQTHRNPLLEYLLPSLLYVKMVSILDEALSTYIDEQNLILPKKHKNSLQNKVDFLTDKNILHNSEVLHDIRETRNALAHNTTKQVGWDELKHDLSEIQTTFEQLTLTDMRPKYEFFAERSAMKGSTEAGVSATQDFSYGLKEGNRVVVEVTWTEKLLEDEQE
ncbi:MAG: hypothetical protein U0X92_09045 [Anaerolineales bacterium]